MGPLRALLLPCLAPPPSPLRMMVTTPPLRTKHPVTPTPSSAQPTMSPPAWLLAPMDPGTRPPVCLKPPVPLHLPSPPTVVSTLPLLTRLTPAPTPLFALRTMWPPRRPSRVLTGRGALLPATQHAPLR